MKKLSLTLLIATLLLFQLKSNAQGKVESDNSLVYVSQTGKCSVTFPTAFTKKEKTTKKGLLSTTVKAKKGKDTYMLIHAKHSKSFPKTKTDEVLDNSVETFAKRMKGTVERERIIKAKSAFINLNESKLNVFYKVFFIGKIQYQFMVISSKTKKTKAMKDFFRSFEYIK